MPTKRQFKKTLQYLIDDATRRLHKTLAEKNPIWVNFETWKTLCQDTIDLIYGPNSRNLTEFNTIRFSGGDSDKNDAERNITFIIGLVTATQRLKGFLLTVENFIEDENNRNSITYPTVFLSHSGKSQKLANILTDFLQNLGATVIDVMKKPNNYLSIDKKVETYIEKCTLGIALITAEDVMLNGEKRERQNIDHEIGMMTTSENINKRIILLKEDSIKDLPSNIQNKSYLTFNRSNFASIYSDLIKDIRSFGFY